MPRSNDADPPRFQPRDILRQVVLTQPVVDPTGRWVAYARKTIERNTYRDRIWRVAAGGGKPACIAWAGRHSPRPRFSPDGGALLYLADRRGRLEPWVADADGGDPRPLGGLPGPVTAAEWLPDGRTIAVLAPSGVERFLAGTPRNPVVRVIRDLTWRRDGIGIRDQFTSLWLVDVMTGEAQRLTAPTFEVARLAVAPDGRLAVLADTGPTAGLEEHPQAHLVDPGSGALTPLAALPGEVLGLGWSPAGQLAVVGNDMPGAPGYHATGLFVVADGTVRRLGAVLDRPVTNLVHNDLSGLAYTPPTALWTDEAHVVSHVTSAGYSVACRFGLDGSVERLTPEASIVGAMALGGGRLVAVAIDLSARPGAAAGPEVCLIEDGELHPLTRHGSSWLGAVLRRPNEHTITARDGHAVLAWSLRGRGVAGPGPCVLEVHGGAPGSMRGPYPTSLHLALADAGFNVIWAEPRGSGGFGHGHCPDDASSWEPAFNDLVDVVLWAIGDGRLAERGRIGVTGSSYGGFMTTWLLGREPDLFAAGAIEVPLTDMVSGLLASDMRAHSDLAFPADWERMHSISPYRWIGDTRAATLLLHNDSDVRCLPFQTDMIFDILRRAGRTVEMVRYPGEPHTLPLIGRPDRRVDRLERITAWFARHLPPTPPTRSLRP